MKTISDYREQLETEIDNAEIDLKIVNNIVLRFTEKGFNGLRVVNLFNRNEGSVTVDKLEGYELAGIFTELYDLTNRLEKYNPSGIPARAREEYEKGRIVIENNSNIFEIENMIKTSENSYLGFWKLEDIYKARKEGKIRYNLDTQREATYKTTKQGKIKRVATINMNSVNEIAEELYNGTYGIPDTLTLNIPIYMDKEPNFKFENGKITIELDPDFDSEHFTMVDSIDGEHRQLATIKAMMRAEKEGLTLQGGFNLAVTLQTEDEANNYVARLQKANVISTNYTKAIESNDYTTLVDEINKSKGLLQGKIDITFEEMRRLGGYTHTLVLVDAMKKLDVAVNSIGKRVAFKKAFSKIMNVLEENLKDEEYNKFEDKYLACNTFAAYVTIADYMMKNNKDDEWLLNCFIVVNLLFEEEDGKLKLDYKSTTHIGLILDMFKEICKTVV